MRDFTDTQLSLVPLGAGDLIDRSVRLYRRHFMTLVKIAAPPVLVSSLGWVLLSVGWREALVTADDMALALYVLLACAGFLLWISGLLLSGVVLGGATRNLVAHLLSGEPVSVRTTYRNVRARFGALLGATLLVGLLIFVFAMLAVVVLYIVVLFAILATFAFAQVAAWLAAVVGVLGTLLAIACALWVFFFLAGRFAYVPQAMMVEGKGVFDAISRSTQLASGNVRRLAAMTIFTTFATYSTLMILLVPLGWYGYLNGISPWNSNQWPAWYSIGYSVLLQSSSMLLTPVWLLGLSLLYVDERVRNEGYDVELMASRRLGEMPRLAGGRAAPYAPALVTEEAAMLQGQPPAGKWSPGSTLGLG
ncbi:MAG TPA: hypothetical protein VJS44_21245 [Pyrinomonadaceae bacterium]|nr:hypothetical protein [Pyrinomonadaceae bacterium]